MLSGAYRKKAKRDKGSYVIRKFIKISEGGTDHSDASALYCRWSV